MDFTNLWNYKYSSQLNRQVPFLVRAIYHWLCNPRMLLFLLLLVVV